MKYLKRTAIIGASKLEESLERDRAVICRSKGGHIFTEQWKLFIDLMRLVHGEGSVKTIYSGPPRGEEPKPIFKIEDLVEKYKNPDAVGLELQSFPAVPAQPEQESDYYKLNKEAKNAVKSLYSIGPFTRFAYDIVRVLGRDIYEGQVRKVKSAVKALIDDDDSDLDRISGTLESQERSQDVEKNNCTYLANRIVATKKQMDELYAKRKKAEQDIKKYHSLAGEFPEKKDYDEAYSASTKEAESLRMQIEALAQQVLSDGNKLINLDRAINLSNALLDCSKKKIEALEERKQRFEKFYESLHYNPPFAAMLCLPSVPFELREKYVG